MCETVPNENRNAAAFLIADAAGGCTQVNSGWTRITGLDPEMNSGDGWLDLAHPDDRDRLREEWEACVLRQGDLAVTVRLHSGDPVDVRAAAMPAGFVVTLEIGEVERDEAELLHARKMEAVGRLASGLAHDFANLLTLISGYSEILLGRMHASDPSRPEVDEIHKAANRGAGLTSQLLTYSRRHAVEPQVLNLNALVANMQSMLRRMIGEHIDLDTQLAAELGSLKADAGQIEQVIMNLAINARDAMPRGGKISVRTANVDVGPDHERAGFGMQPGRYVMLQVGRHRARNRAGDARTPVRALLHHQGKRERDGPGTGDRLWNRQAGRRRCVGAKRAGKGSTFTIYLPRVAETSAAGGVEGRQCEPRGRALKPFCWWRTKTAFAVCSNTCSARSDTP